MKTSVISATLVASLFLSGCKSSSFMDDESDIYAEATPIPGSFGLNTARLVGEGALVMQGASRNYVVLYGPRPGVNETFSGYLDLRTGTVTVETGFAYVAGQLPLQSFAQLPTTMSATMVVPWPVIKTKNIRAAATGTILIVEADGLNDRVYRLAPASSKTVRVYSGTSSTSAPAVEIPETEAADKVIHNGLNGLSEPADPSSTERDFISKVISLAQAQGLPIP